ncbi:MAG: hypothetical protein JXA67_04740, partial [Micromonosporaceae bacterium]|nr:hypothetical protein [Micromonosporaceae bacterium]
TWLYRRSAQLFAPSDPRDAVAAAVDELIAATIARVVPDLVLAPLGLGDHVDHLAVQSSARLIGRERGIPVLLWEDQPYALRRHPWASPPAGATTALQVPLPPAAWSRKIEAIRCYTSQLRMLFDPDEDWAALFTGYATAVSGTGGEPAERFWV